MHDPWTRKHGPNPTAQTLKTIPTELQVATIATIHVNVHTRQSIDATATNRTKCNRKPAHPASQPAPVRHTRAQIETVRRQLPGVGSRGGSDGLHRQRLHGWRGRPEESSRGGRGEVGGGGEVVHEGAVEDPGGALGGGHGGEIAGTGGRWPEEARVPRTRPELGDSGAVRWTWEEAVVRSWARTPRLRMELSGVWGTQ